MGMCGIASSLSLWQKTGTRKPWKRREDLQRNRKGLKRAGMIHTASTMLRGKRFRLVQMVTI